MIWRLIIGDCIEAMQDMDEASVDAIVTDPPYGLHFMGKTWDRFGGPTGSDNTKHSERGGAMHAGSYDLTPEGQRGFQREAYGWGLAMLRVLKPGGHLLMFGGTRTYHRLTCALEDAGFEIRDCLAWLYGSGFPKSLDVSKAIDKAAGAERKVVPGRHVREVTTPTGIVPNGRCVSCGRVAGSQPGNCQCEKHSAPVTPDAEQWQGWGTALKPAFEPIVLARKPLAGTVAQNVLEHGTGALNIDETRIGTNNKTPAPTRRRDSESWFTTNDATNLGGNDALGRWPANVILDEEAAAMLDEQSGELGKITGGRPGGKERGIFGAFKGMDRPVVQYPDDTGGASRFFYIPKADRQERERGIAEYGDREARPSGIKNDSGRGFSERDPYAQIMRRNNHPTVKPVELMQWLCRLITPPKGTVLDPFTGSGTTGIAALREGFSFIGIEREPEYVEIARDRIIGDAPLFNVPAEVVEA